MLAVVAIVLLAQWSWPRGVHHASAAEGDATPSVAPGLTLAFAADPSGPTVDERPARLVALSTVAGQLPSPMLRPGPFVATWTGLMSSGPRKIKENYRFTAEGTGHLRVTINGKLVLDAVGDLSTHPSDLIELHKSRNKLTVAYQPPPTGPAVCRLLWARDDHPTYFNPVPPTVFTHDVADADYVQHGRVRLGRQLLTTMRCAACHQGVTGTVPELKQDAPNLADVGRRLKPEYMAAWIADPKAIRPTTDMPAVLHDPGAAGQAADVAAYLSANAPPVPAWPAADAATLAKGARLFTGLGCVACHVAPGTDDSDPTLNRISLKYVKAKFTPDGLTQWLRAPEAHYAWVKMPNFHLADAEVTALSAWLVARCKDDALPPAPPGDAARGKATFVAAGCTSCHVGPDNAATAPPAAVALAHADFTHGCLAPKPAGDAVDYAFAPEQTAALRAVAATDWPATLAVDPPADFAARQMTAVRCYACHHIDGNDSTWSNLDGEVSAIEADLPPRPTDDPEPQGDQTPPPLTWAGDKLRSSWIADFVAGRVPYKPRSWMFPRMPAFASRAAGLAAGLSEQHGIDPAQPDVRPAPDLHLAAIGRDLTAQTRFGCVKCHSVGNQAAIAPFEAYAPNFAHVTDRLRFGYYARWMRNPQIYLPGTKMPAFGNAEGQTPYKDILGGDADAEYRAIWTYLLAGNQMVPAQ